MFLRRPDFDKRAVGISNYQNYPFLQYVNKKRPSFGLGGDGGKPLQVGPFF